MSPTPTPTRYREVAAGHSDGSADLEFRCARRAGSIRAEIRRLESVGNTDTTAAELVPDVESEALAVRPKTAELTPSDAAKLHDLIREGTPENTLRAREGDLRRFWGEVDVAESYPVPLAVILGWMTRALERYAVATVERTVRTLSRAHHAAGVAKGQNPCLSAPLREVLRAAKVRAAKRGRTQRQASPVQAGDVRRMVATCAADVSGMGTDDEPVWAGSGRVGSPLGVSRESWFHGPSSPGSSIAHRTDSGPDSLPMRSRPESPRRTSWPDGGSPFPRSPATRAHGKPSRIPPPS